MSKSDFAVIKTGGKQYKVRVGDKLLVEKLANDAGGVFKFEDVLLKSGGGKTEIGAPIVKGASVEAAVVRQMREDKKIVFRFHSKTRYRKFKGHRQPKTEVKITAIR